MLVLAVQFLFVLIFLFKIEIAWLTPTLLVVIVFVVCLSVDGAGTPLLFLALAVDRFPLIIYINNKYKIPDLFPHFHFN